ncbi:MAG: hypothetical protein ACI4RT_07010 [Candidatus Spyradenecus sp.]
MNTVKSLAHLLSKLRNGLRLGEAYLTLFPIVVVSTVWLTMLAGGRLVGAHWWGSLGIMALWVGLKRGYTRAAKLQAIAWVVLFLISIWVWSGVSLSGTSITSAAYQEPGIRLLVAGWNPLREATPEAVESAMGAPTWSYRPWHLLFIPKSVWVFNAAAYGFTRTPFNPQFPLFCFLLVSCLAEAWRLFRGVSTGIRALLLLALWWNAPGVDLCVDSAVYFGGIMLLSAMARRIRGEHETGQSLVCGSFWMICAKQPGMLACVVFWGLFLPVMWRRGGWQAMQKIFVQGTIVAGLATLACLSPYWTAWRDYGHPLYPAWTTDPKRFPSHDVTVDFKMANEDAESMGHFGSFCNAYLSPLLTQAYYRWRLDKPNFFPFRETWKQTSGEESPRPYPLPNKERWLLLGSLVLLLYKGRPEERFVVWAIIGALFLYPATHMGYLRYQPWFVMMEYLAFTRALVLANGRWPRMTRLSVGLLGGLWVARIGIITGTGVCAGIDQVFALQSYLSQTAPEAIYSCIWTGDLAQSYETQKWSPEALAVFGHPGEVAVLNFWLLRREIAPLAKSRIVIIDPPSAEVDYPSLLSGLQVRVAAPSVANHFSYFAQNQQIPNRSQRLRNYPGIALRVFFRQLPILLVDRIAHRGLTAKCIRRPLTNSERAVERLGTMHE